MDSINQISSNKTSTKSSPATDAKPRERSGEVEGTKKATPDVHVDLSSQLTSAESEAIMREAKVKEMREAIEEGRFPLDAKKIAENFAELEKLL